MFQRQSNRGGNTSSAREVRFMSTEGFNDRLIEGVDAVQDSAPKGKKSTDRDDGMISSKRLYGDGKLQQTERFMEELRNQIGTTMKFEGIKEADEAENEGIKRAQVCIDSRDQFTPEFVDELKQIGEKERKLLDRWESMVPVPDLFGILRRQCEACNDYCVGYRPQGVVCPSPSGELDFPTFCQNCGCPGCFHAVIKSKDSLPESLAASLRGYNIRQQDLNFNGALIVFEIIDESKAGQNTGQLINLLKTEGIEILSLETRPLDVQEAMYLNIRSLIAKEKELDKYLYPGGYDHEKIRKERQIHAPGTNIFGAAIRCDYFLMDKISNDVEVALKRKAAKILNPKTGMVPTKRGDSKNQGKDKSRENSSQRGGSGQKASRTMRSAEMDPDGGYFFDDLARDIYLGPRQEAQTFKIRTQAEINRMEDLGSSAHQARKVSLGKKKDEIKLLQTLQRNPEVKRLLMKQFLLVVVSSTLHHHVDKKIRDEVIDDYFDLVSKEEIKLQHISQRKIEAMEDSVLFAPYLYRLQKSIIVTEPADSLFGFEGRAKIRGSQPGSYLDQASQSMPNMEEHPLAAEFALKKEGKTFNPGKRQTGMTKYLTRRLKGFADDQAYLSAALPEKRKDSVKLYVEESVMEDQKPKKTLKDTKWTKIDPEENRIFANFGTMVDFFDYSGVRVQEAIRARDLRRPVSFGKMLLPFSDLEAQYQKLVTRITKEGDEKKVNLFAVAKVGTPNMIFPTTLDVQMRNFQDPHQYIQISDYFFPNVSKNQMTVVILRPLIVKNGLNDLFVEILKANDFLIIKRIVKTISREEALTICHMEKVTKSNVELYIDTVLAGPSEIVIMSKIGAIQDAKTISSGSLTGRRRSNQVGESGSGTRQNVDSLSAMFEIAPFSSFNEFLDLEDFLLEHSRIFKYKNQSQEVSNMDQVEALNFQKALEIRMLLNTFMRNARLASIAAPTEQDAKMLIDLFDPATGQLEELIFLLNPLYNHLVPQVEELLVRMQYCFVNKQVIVVKSEQAKNLLMEKFPAGKKMERLVQILEGSEVHFYHLTKHVALQEIQALYELSDVTFEDHLMHHPKIVSEKGAFLAEHIPYLFLLMDSTQMFEKAAELLYEPAIMRYTGSDFIDKLSTNQKNKIIEICLFTTTGQSTYMGIFDSKYNLIRDRNGENLTGVKMSYLCRQQQRNLVGPFGEKYTEEPMIRSINTFAASTESSLHFVVESDEHMVYEIRIHKINHRGDVNPSSLQVEDQQIAENIEFDEPAVPTKKKHVHILLDDEHDKQVTAQKEMLYFFQRFSTLAFYYQEVKKKWGGGLVPSFYRFKIYPMNGEPINRVYEVEEHMGRVFIDELADMHYQHSQLHRQQHDDRLRRAIGDDRTKAKAITRQKQRSLPSYVYGSQLAQLVKKLEKVRCAKEDTLKGAGPLIYDTDQQVIRGEQQTKNFSKVRQRMYHVMLEQMQNRWHFYVSKLETDLIESKLMFILNSLTFKYSRSNDYLSLIPDRINEMNLRLKSTIKIISDGYKMDSAYAKMNDDEREEKGFYKDVYNDPNRAKDLENQLGSVLYAISQDAKQENQPERKLKDHLERTQYSTQLTKTLLPTKSYIIHRHPAISGVSVAKRPKTQLIASILFLIKFWMKKVDPKPHLFGKQSTQHDSATPEDPEEAYNIFLESLENGLVESYGEDEINKVVDIRALKQSNLSEFDEILNIKLEQQEQLKLIQNQRFQTMRRKWRNNPDLTLQQLINVEVRRPAMEEDRKKKPYIEEYMEQRIKGMHDDEINVQFKELLDKAGMKFGNNIFKLANDFCAKMELEKEKQRLGKESIQEKISLVRMEYFLYAFSFAYGIQNDIIKYKNMIEIFQEQVDKLERDKALITQKINQARKARDMSSKIMEDALKRLNDDVKRIDMDINSSQKRINDTEFKRSKKEQQMLLTLRELCFCEIFAPEECFKGDRIVQKSKLSTLMEEAQEKDIIRPMDNFWKPLQYEQDDLVKPNSEQAQRFLVKEDDLYPDDDVGEFLSQGLRNQLVNFGTIKPQDAKAKQAAREKQGQEQENVRRVNKLRHVERPKFTDDIRFKALQNPAYAREREAFQTMKKDLLLKTQTPTPVGPVPDTSFTPDLITPGHDLTPGQAKDIYVDDPFSHLRNKEKGGQLVRTVIDQYFIDDGSAAQQSGLDEDQCRQLVKQVYRQLQANKINCEDYSETNFDTSFSIYKNRQTGQVDAAKLKNFVMCMAEL